MLPNYDEWLKQQKYQPGTITAQLHRAGRVEEHYGNLDEHYSRDRLQSVIDALIYSSEDKRRNRPNPSKIPFDGDIRSNLASYRDAVKRYRKFRDSADDSGTGPVVTDAVHEEAPTEDGGQRIGLERDLQAALRLQIAQLEEGLTIIDEGAERSVDSGFIDITARDATGIAVVIELKAGPAGQRAIGQILSYMGDVATDEESGKVRGILVASDFDGKARSAAKMVPNLILRKYSVRFLFSDGMVPEP